VRLLTTSGPRLVQMFWFWKWADTHEPIVERERDHRETERETDREGGGEREEEEEEEEGAAPGGVCSASLPVRLSRVQLVNFNSK